jgi:tRNA pseudouridine38-40 synthase
MARYFIKVEYDGTAFCGWQSQEHGASVQQALEAACFSYCGEQVLMYGAGRTDSGVHALCQVAHFDLTEDKNESEIQAAMNFHLHAQEQAVRVLSVERVSDNLHARFSAQQRHYVYFILNRQAPAVLSRGRVWHIQQPLDREKMQASTDIFIGTHNWTTFRAAGCQSPSPVKTLNRLEVTTKEDKIIIAASAKSFLHHQVRSLVGALVEVGKNKLTPAQLKGILDAQNRKCCPPPAPAYGLYLAKVDYADTILKKEFPYETIPSYS